jgi:hypothetical protein
MAEGKSESDLSQIFTCAGSLNKKEHHTPHILPMHCIWNATSFFSMGIQRPMGTTAHHDLTWTPLHAQQYMGSWHMDEKSAQLRPLERVRTTWSMPQKASDRSVIMSSCLQVQPCPGLPLSYSCYLSTSPPCTKNFSSRSSYQHFSTFHHSISNRSCPNLEANPRDEGPNQHKYHQLKTHY